MRGLARRALAGFVGTAALVAAIIGSGVAATALTSDGGGRLAINAVVTALTLLVILVVLGPISGVSLAEPSARSCSA